MSETAVGQAVPVNALFKGDFITHLVLLMDTDSIAVAAGKVAALVVGSRVKAQDRPFVLTHDGRVIAPELTVATAGIGALSEVFVGYAE